MLTKSDKEYLKRVPKGKIVSIKKFDPRAKRIGKLIIKKIRTEFPKVTIKFMGSTLFEISGQQDIDIYVMAKRSNFSKYIPGLTKLFGKPNHKFNKFISWDVERDGFIIDLYLTDPNRTSLKKQLKIYNILKNNKKLLKEYESLKKKMHGKPLKQYQKRKMEFFNKILS